MKQLWWLLLIFWICPVWAEVNVGVILSLTGPAASLGLPQKNVISLLPTIIGNEKINYIVLDDASDPTLAVINAKKLISEYRVDIIFGSSNTPSTLAIIETIAEAEVPVLSFAGSSKIVEPLDLKRRWMFKTTANDSVFIASIVHHMIRSNIKTVGFIGFSNAYGEGWWNDFNSIAREHKITIVGNERYNPTDTSTVGQILRIMSSNPDAVLIAGAGTPSITPQLNLVAQQYKGFIYQSSASANSDFIRVGGKDVEGTFIPVGLVLIADQFDNGNPVKLAAAEYSRTYKEKFGNFNLSSGSHAWNAGIIMKAVIPDVLKKTKPGTKEFRIVLRDSIESIRALPGVNGVYNMSPVDHSGLDYNAAAIIRIENGMWKLVK